MIKKTLLLLILLLTLNSCVISKELREVEYDIHTYSRLVVDLEYESFITLIKSSFGVKKVKKETIYNQSKIKSYFEKVGSRFRIDERFHVLRERNFQSDFKELGLNGGCSINNTCYMVQLNGYFPYVSPSVLLNEKPAKLRGQFGLLLRKISKNKSELHVFPYDLYAITAKGCCSLKEGIGLKVKTAKVKSARYEQYRLLMVFGDLLKDSEINFAYLD